MLAIGTILHPTDFSTGATLAFRLASSLARDYGARLLVLHVIEPPPVQGGMGVFMPPAEIDRDLLQEKLALEFRDPQVLVEHRLAEGDPATEIIRVADEVQADVIVMGTHGRSGAGRLFIGSVAEKVVRAAACPVATVKSPQPSPESPSGEGVSAQSALLT